MKTSPESGNPTTGPKLWIVLARAYTALASYVESSIVAAGLCLSDFMVLEVLLHKGPMSISDIGAKVLLANASMTAAVDRLEQRGFVLRQAAKNDRRSKIVVLTKDGRSLISQLYAHHAEDIEAVTSALTQKERDQLRLLLKTLGLSAKNELERRSPAAIAATPKEQIHSNKRLRR